MTDQVLSISDALKRRLAKKIGRLESKIKAVMNGVDLQRFSNHLPRGKIRNSLGISSHSIVIGTVGRFEPVKDQATFLRAMAILLKTYSNNIKAILVGDGPLREDLHAVTSKLKINEHVTFLGKRDDIPDLLRVMDIFVLPSISEGISNTILEAMASALPVVATDVGGTPEIVENGVTGLLVPKENPEIMARSLLELIEDQEKRKTMGQQGRKNAEKYFSIERMVDTYESLYISLLRKKSIKN
jgi:glycosyltransferase involved in cell wall biosynthesis